MAQKLTGALYAFDTHALYIGPLLAVPLHRHHAGQILWVPLGVYVGDDREPLRQVTTHVVAPHRAHRHGEATMAAVLWIDRDDVRWDRFRRPSNDFDARGSRVEDALDALDALDPAAAGAIADALLAWVMPKNETPAPCHPAVQRMCQMLDASASHEKTSVTELAAASGLSVRQLRHRFTEDLGINPSGYRRWRRLRRAIAAIERGATLTEGAVAAGFADSAHFSRVFHAQFGMAPSQALTSLRVAIVRAHSTDRGVLSICRK